VWRRLLAAGAMQGDVVIDLYRPATSNVVGMGAGVFVTDEFIRVAKTSMPPYVRARIVDLILQDKSPVLSASQIHGAKAGLNLFILDDMMFNPDLTVAEIRAVRNLGAQAGLARFRAFQLQEFMNEAYGDENSKLMVMAGGVIRRDYSEYASTGFFESGACERPYLVGLRRDELETLDGSLFAMLFDHAPKRFFFRHAERELLQFGLLGQTDEELANSLGISLSAVKKRWSSIYERVERVDPDLIPEDRANNNSDRKRGTEKRRYVLNHLREHPEELQPKIV
jgi:hypothetical protein